MRILLMISRNIKTKVIYSYKVYISKATKKYKQVSEGKSKAKALGHVKADSGLKMYMELGKPVLIYVSTLGGNGEYSKTVE